MSSEELVGKIAEEADIEEEKVREEIEEKMEEFSGMVSEEGAIHLVAKEHGIDLSDGDNSDLKIENVVPDMRKVKVKARVTNVLDPNTFERDEGEQGKVQNVVLADETGSIRLTLWDEQTQIAEKVSEGDAIKVSGAYTVEDNQGNAELRLGDEAQVSMADEGEVPEIETGGGEAEKATIREVQDENSNYQVRGMIMTVYTSNPFYRVDPETGDTVRENDDGEYVTDDGEVVEDPDHRLALSAVIDDGTGNIRTVFFGEQARELLEIDEETERDGEIRKIEKAAENAVGKQLQITGRTRYNDYFGTLEILVNEIEETEIEQELNDLLELMEA